MKFILRHPNPQDIKAYYETETDSEAKEMFSSFPKNIEEAKKDLRKIIKDNKKKIVLSETFAIEVKKSFAGYVKLQYQNFDFKSNEGRVHIAIHPNFRGKGLATKVLKKTLEYGFRKKKMKKIFCQCKSINKGIIKIAEKLGFEKIRTHTNEFGVKKVLFAKENPFI